eukprot:jgi/Mesvir1/15641/Mv03246-RA.1
MTVARALVPGRWQRPGPLTSFSALGGPRKCLRVAKPCGPRPCCSMGPFLSQAFKVVSDLLTWGMMLGFLFTTLAATPTTKPLRQCGRCRGRGLVQCALCQGAGEVRLEGTKYVVCPSCNGTNTRTCPECNGRRILAPLSSRRRPKR